MKIDYLAHPCLSSVTGDDAAVEEPTYSNRGHYAPCLRRLSLRNPDIVTNMDPQEFPGGPRAEDRPSRSAKIFLKVSETLEDTWLADPVRKGYAVGDWDLQKSAFPQLSKTLSSLAPTEKEWAG